MTSESVSEEYGCPGKVEESFSEEYGCPESSGGREGIPPGELVVLVLVFPNFSSMREYKVAIFFNRGFA